MSANNKKAAPAEEGGGESAPLWIISFADMISLLMAFFVMLSTFTSFDKDERQKYHAVIETSMQPVGGIFSEKSGNALAAGSPLATEIEGSSTPTDTAAQQSKGLNRSSSSVDFRKFKIFDISSQEMFVAKTAALGPEGRQWLDAMAAFLAEIEGGIIVSEQGSRLSDDNTLKRIIAVMEYLERKGISSSRLNLSYRGMLAPQQYQQQPMVEICLLEADIKI